jgi:hypothetical protein
LELQQSHDTIEFATEKTDPLWAPTKPFRPCFRGSWSATRARKFSMLPVTETLITQRSVVQIHPPQPKLLLFLDPTKLLSMQSHLLSFLLGVYRGFGIYF